MPIKRHLERTGIPGAAVAIVSESGVTLDTYGVLEAGSAHPVSEDTAFDIGSCSKSVVSAAVGVLVSSGELGFDDAVAGHLPELEMDTPDITKRLSIRDLLGNRIGLKRQLPVESFANAEIDVADILARVRHLERIRPFRDGYVYFNPGFMAARVIVERVSGLPYEQFVARHLFAPLGMRDSASGSWVEKLEEAATGHIIRDGVAIPLVNAPRFDNWQGAAGVYFSISDAARWLRFQLTGQCAGTRAPLSTAVLKELQLPQTPIPTAECKLIHQPPGGAGCEYCMGWWTSSFGGQPVVQHAGEMFGWRSHFAMLPEVGVGVAVLLSAATNLHAATAYALLEEVTGADRRDWWAIAEGASERDRWRLVSMVEDAFPCTAGTPLTLPLAEYAGEYRNPASGTATVSAHGDELLLRLEDGRVWDCRLRHLGGDTFEASLVNDMMRDYLPVPARVRFEIDNQKVVALSDINAVFTRRHDNTKP